MSGALEILRDQKLRQQVTELVKERNQVKPIEFFKNRELFYFNQICSAYKNAPLDAFKDGYAQIPQFYQQVKRGDFTLNALKYRFGFGFLVPATLIAGISFYVGKSSAYLLRKDGDVLGVKH